MCGCTFLSPRLSAATWLERLFEHGTRRWVREECERFPSVVTLAVHLCLVVRDERAVPLGLPCLLRLPMVARAVMECEAVLDLATCNRDASGRREGRRWLALQRGKGGQGGTTGGGTASGGAASGGAAPGSPSPGSVSGVPAGAAPMSPAPSTLASPGAAPASPVPATLAVVASTSAAPSRNGAGGGAIGAITGDGASEAVPMRAQAPVQRLGEWLMASLGYLLVLVDDDALLAAHACSALLRLALAAPGGVARLTEGVWVGLPMLERLSMLACQHTAALELLEALARHSPSARTAMRSLAAALAAATPAGGNAGIVPLGDVAPSTSRDVTMEVAAEDVDGEPLEASANHVERGTTTATSGPRAAATNSGQSATSGTDVAGGRARWAQEPRDRDQHRDAQREHEHDHEHEGLGEPSWSWVECYHELHDELWIGQQQKTDTVEDEAIGADDGASGISTTDNALGESSETEVRRHSPPPFHGLVSLGNFEEAAPEVPVTGRLVATLPAAPVAACHAGLDEDRGAEAMVGGATSTKWEASAVPAVWNPRFDDLVEARLEMDEAHVDLGTPEWQVGKEGAIVLLLRSAIQRSPATPDWAASVWLCAEAGARAAVVINDLPDDGPAQPAFRMGLFGSPAPPVPGFMVGGREGEVLRAAARQAPPASVHIAVRSTRAEGTPLAPGCGGPPPPPWPLVLRAPQDVAQAWSLVEMVYRAAPSADLEAALDSLAKRMGLPEKRIWLTRRLQRYHRGDTDADEPAEPNLAFVECDRDGNQLLQLRRQLVERTGLAANDITGEFEVRFRDESSVGSAVVREWMDLLAQQAFLPGPHRLLASYDGGISFLPDPAAPFLNPQWKGDFEMLGRLLGLALWQQVTLDLPVHPYVCELLLRSGATPSAAAEDGDGDVAMQLQPQLDSELGSPVMEASPSLEADAERFKSIDAELYRHKVQWLLSNDVTLLGYDMPFTDALVSVEDVAPPAPPAKQAVVLESRLEPLPEVVLPEDALPGEDLAAEPLKLRPCLRGAQVALVPGGQDLVVTEANKATFVERLLEWRLRSSLRGPVAAMVRGLHAVVPPAVLAEAQRMLAPEEVHGLLAGMRNICVDNWEKNTRTVGGITSSSQEVRWFWRAVRQWGAEGRQDRLQDLLQFATGSRRVPVGGFAQLVGFNGGRHLFTLARGAHLSKQSLPTSHACICTIDLPPWETAEAARQKLLAASEAGRARFDEGPAAAATVEGQGRRGDAE